MPPTTDREGYTEARNCWGYEYQTPNHAEHLDVHIRRLGCVDVDKDRVYEHGRGGSAHSNIFGRLPNRQAGNLLRLALRTSRPPVQLGEAVSYGQVFTY